MKLVSYEQGGVQGFGCMAGAGIVALDKRLGVGSLRAMLTAGLMGEARRLSHAGPDFALDAVRLLPPVPDPAKMLGVGLNYREHIDETDYKPVPYPTLFVRFADTVVGSGSAIVRPINSQALDFEGELAVVIGKGGRHIPPERAADHIAGFACFNDASIRDWQFHTTQVIPGKNFPAVGGFGPALVTLDELPAREEMSLTTRLNGAVMQHASLSEMIFSVENIIAYCSSFTPLSPGDVIATGSPAGIGNRRNPKVFMKPGDIVEVEITVLGILVNPIEAEAA